MSKINDGGPAFPLQSIGPEFTPGYAGMTLRDYFAAKALPICMQNGLEMMKETGNVISPEEFKIAVCADAYGWADAMIKTRHDFALFEAKK